MNLFELVTSENMVAYWIERDLYSVTVGDQLFPQKKEIGIELDFIKGYGDKVVQLKLSAWDAKAIRRDRKGIERVRTEMPFFKESMVIDEKTRQQINVFLQTQNMSLIAPYLDRIFADNVGLIKAAFEAVERARMQLMTTGTVTLASNGQAYTYDYGVPAANKRNAATAWNNSAADPIKDIQDAKDLAKAKGYNLTRAMCNTECLKDLLNNTSIKNRIYVLAGGNVTITFDQIVKYIEAEAGISIYVQDNGYVDESGNFTKYYANDVFTLFPEGPLGYTHYGTTPEESDLMTGGTDAEVALVDNAIAVTTSKIVDPVNVETKVSMVMLPSLEMADALYILDTRP